MKLPAFFDLVDETITGHWTKGTMFRDGRKSLVTKQSEAAYFCILGGMKYNSAYLSHDKYIEALNILHEVIGEKNIIFWNDAAERTEADIHTKLAEAKALAKMRETVI